MGVESYEKEMIMDQEPIDRGLLAETETQNRPEQRAIPSMAEMSAFHALMTGLTSRTFGPYMADQLLPPALP